MRSGLTARVLAGLVLGFAVGLALGGRASAPVRAAVATAAALGAVFVNLIRMTAVPLVASMLVASVGSFGVEARFGRTVARAFLLAAVLLVVAAAASVAIAGPVFERLPIDRAAAEALRQTADGGGRPVAPSAAATPSQWLIDLVPSNPIRAAADDLMLPTIVFSVLFGFAVSRLGGDRRTLLVGFADAAAAAMQKLVALILELAPYGVFALAVPLAARLGASAAGAVAAYIVLVVALTVALTALLLYPVAVFSSGLSLPAFAALSGPSQAVAFASRSSLAALPAMLESVERAGFPREVGGILLPLAASTFRFGGAIAQIVGVLFLARLYGIDLDAARLASVFALVVFTTFAVPGIPGGSIIAMVPVLTAARIPVEGIGILLAVDTIPDMFRTTANVTGSMTVAVSVARAPGRH